MQVTSVFMQTLSLINLRLNLTREELELIVDSLLTSENYRRLRDNLYHNWTVDNNFYYTISFSGKPTPPTAAESFEASHEFFRLDGKQFLHHVVKLCKDKSAAPLREMLQNYSEFVKWAQSVSLEII
jgi:hypothetical protein